MSTPKFKVGDVCYWYDDEDDIRGQAGPIIFCGTGKESAKLYPEHAKYRRNTPYVVMWDKSTWVDMKHVRKLSKLERALR